MQTLIIAANSRPAYNACYYHTIILSYQGTALLTKHATIVLSYHHIRAQPCLQRRLLSYYHTIISGHRYLDKRKQGEANRSSRAPIRVCSMCFVRHSQYVCALCATCSISKLCVPLAAYLCAVLQLRISVLCAPLAAYLCFVCHLQHIYALCVPLTAYRSFVCHSQHIYALCATCSISVLCAPVAAYLCFERHSQHIYALCATRSIFVLRAPLAICSLCASCSILCFVRHLLHVPIHGTWVTVLYITYKNNQLLPSKIM